VFKRSLARHLYLALLLTVPGWAIDTTYNSSTAPVDWYATYSNIITFDGLTESYIGPGSNLLLSGVNFYGFMGTPSATNSALLVVAEDNSGEPWYNYGGTGPYGTVVSNPRVLRSNAPSGTTPVGFEIVLPSAVTAFGLQIMSSQPYNVQVELDGAAISNPGGAYPAGTLTTASSKGRTFFGVTSTTAFTTIDIIGSPGISGEYLVIDNISYGTAPVFTAEPQSAVFLLIGLGALLAARKLSLLQIAQS